MLEKLNNPKTLRVITLVVLIYSILVAFLQLITMVSVFYMKPEEGEVVTPAAKQFIVFPFYFLLPIFLLIIWYCSKILLKKEYNLKPIIALAIFSILYFAFGSEVYSFIQSFSSYNA